MPLYEYQCQSCDQRTEVLQRFADDPLTTCEACGGDLKRLISAPAVQFKGSGWYVTDYAGKGGKSKKGESGGSSGSGEGSSSSDSGSGKSDSGSGKSDSGSGKSDSGGSSSSKDGAKKTANG
jgi:putative FmdB family regulatory protein